MAKPQDLEKIALVLPGAESAARSTSFCTATYKVEGRNFAAIEKRDGATFALDAVEVRKLTERTPDVFEPITRPGQVVLKAGATIDSVQLVAISQLLAKTFKINVSDE